MKRLTLLALVAAVLLATNPSLDEFKAYAALGSNNPSDVVAARTSYWFLFSVFQSGRYDKASQRWDGYKTYVGVLHNFLYVGTH